MRNRFTGTVTRKAIAKDTAKLHQKSQEVTTAFMAPGMSHSSVLSTISIEVIEIVSVAQAMLAACRVVAPVRTAPAKVKA